MKNKTKIVSWLMGLMCLLTVTAGTPGIIAEESGIAFVGAVIGGVVLILVASALMGTISDNTKSASANLTTDGFTSTASIVNQWPLAVGIMVFIAIFSAVL